jgi:GNAT superfamily N-acetyltransferase
MANKSIQLTVKSAVSLRYTLLLTAADARRYMLLEMGVRMSSVEIRQATIEDSALIYRFIKDLAVYEKAETEVFATVADIENSLFGEKTTTNAVICNFNNEPIGFAVYFFNLSTWLGKHGLYLEDLYVSLEHRGVGAGKALMKYLAKIALSKIVVALNGTYLTGMSQRYSSINQ